MKNKNSARQIFRLIVGAVSVILSFPVSFYSCTAEFGEDLSGGESGGGLAGSVMGLFMLVSGIITLAMRKSSGETLISIIMYLFAGIVSLTDKASFKNLKILSVVSLVFALLLIISLFVKNKNNGNSDNSKQ